MSELSIQHVSPVWSRSSSFVAERGEGAHLFSTQGEPYLDFTCGIGVTNTGHCHPRVVEAIQQQAARLIHGQLNIVYHEPVLNLIAELRSILPGKFDGYFFSNSGAEAVEGAVKLARAVTRRTNVIVFQGSFHGRTVGAMSLTTSKTIYRAGYQPLMSGVFVAPFPYAYRYGWERDETVKWCLGELRLLLETQTAPDETAAILIEPVLGEGGYVDAPPAFLQGLREVCDEHGIMLIMDEVQSGFGRTAEWFGYEHSDIEPDMIVVAKGLASGMPLSGVISSLALMERWKPGSHGGTYGGNPIACAAATATIQAIRDEKMIANARNRGEQLTDGLTEIQSRFPLIGDVRGMGLMIGVELTQPSGTPAGETVKKILAACHYEKLMLLACGAYGNIIRFIPPLIVSEAQINQALEVFDGAIADSIEA